MGMDGSDDFPIQKILFFGFNMLCYVNFQGCMGIIYIYITFQNILNTMNLNRNQIEEHCIQDTAD